MGCIGDLGETWHRGLLYMCIACEPAPPGWLLLLPPELPLWNRSDGCPGVGWREVRPCRTNTQQGASVGLVWLNTKQSLLNLLYRAAC